MKQEAFIDDFFVFGLDFSKTLEFFGEHELKQQQEIVKSIHKTIHEGTGAGSDFLGWVDFTS